MSRCWRTWTVSCRSCLMVGPSVYCCMQVDAVKMEAFIDHFLDSMGLSTSYSLLLMSPEWHAFEPVYGYRAGLSRCGRCMHALVH